MVQGRDFASQQLVVRVAEDFECSQAVVDAAAVACVEKEGDPPVKCLHCSPGCGLFHIDLVFYSLLNGAGIHKT
jgi:hypothetical protein